MPPQKGGILFCMNLLRKLAKPETFLRLGLGLMFLYSGYSIYSNPGMWESYVTDLPQWVQMLIAYVHLTVPQFLTIQGVAEMIFGAVLILWFLPLWLVRTVSILITLELASILILIGVTGVTFRDIGLVGAAIALVLTLYRKT